MGRRRKAGDEWLPSRVYRGKSAFEFRPKGAGMITLCPLDAPQRSVWKRYEEEQRKLELRTGTVSQLIEDLVASSDFNKLAPATAKKYCSYAKRVEAVFGKMDAKKVRPEHIRQYMDKRGKTAEIQANREHAFMSKLFGWAYERGRITKNPCKGVKKFTEKPRDRYISDKEYMAVFGCAEPMVQAVMEIAYCCAARVSDVLALTNQQLLNEGIFIEQGKTGKKQIKAWSPRLRAAIEHAQRSQQTRSLIYVVPNKRGQKMAYNTFRTHWTNAKKLAEQRHTDIRFDFTFHDIKAKSISDWEGDKQKFSGHASAKMIEAYDRKTEVVETH